MLVGEDEQSTVGGFVPPPLQYSIFDMFSDLGASL